MVAGSLNCPVPVNLLLRAATEQYGSIDSTLVSDLFRNLDLFRWESSDSEGNEWLIMPRLTLEAQLLCQRRLGSAQAEADCLLALIGSVRQGIDNSKNGGSFQPSFSRFVATAQVVTATYTRIWPSRAN